jgi:hypothetical protein
MINSETVKKGSTFKEVILRESNGNGIWEKGVFQIPKPSAIGYMHIMPYKIECIII